MERTPEAGANSCLLKDTDLGKLLQAIREAHAGRGSIDSTAMQALMRRNRDEERKDWQAGTPIRPQHCQRAQTATRH